ncbi:MAG: Gfo/Idh/MocA family oxidoreductase, partial [Candidatus Omnitrophica bacterium]|nr:Gfo/Idh/MocA family oxidoreductase [Candidatus Omnitrophota bacterium]
MRKINIGLIGFGNVGSEVIKILRERKRFLLEKAGVELNIVKICDKDLVSKRNVKVEKSLLTTDPYEIINDPNVEILVELIGGINPAKEYILKAIEKGKHIITANKALLAE